MLCKRKDKDSMIIAVPSFNGEVFQHFGKTPEFTLFTVENNAVIDKKVQPTMGNGHGALAVFLKQFRVDAAVCGGIGPGAVNALDDMGIKVVSGAEGPVDEAVSAYLQGRRDSNSPVSCHHHDGEEHDCGHHQGGCGEHGCHH